LPGLPNKTMFQEMNVAFSYLPKEKIDLTSTTSELPAYVKIIKSLTFLTVNMQQLMKCGTFIHRNFSQTFISLPF